MQMKQLGRKWISLVLMCCFLTVSITGIIFEFFFKTHSLEEVHVFAGLLMVAVGVWHLINNWAPFRNYLKSIRTVFVIALIFISAVLVIGRGEGEKERQRGINPRMVMNKVSQARLQTAAELFNKVPEQVVGQMKANNLQVDSADLSLIEIARVNHISANELMHYFVD